MKVGDTQNNLQFSKGSPDGTVIVRVIGSLGRLPDGRKLERQTIRAPITIDSLLDLLQKEHGVDIRRDSTLVMVNGVEARALADLGTVVSPGDEVVLVPIFHGG